MRLACVHAHAHTHEDQNVYIRACGWRPRCSIGSSFYCWWGRVVSGNPIPSYHPPISCSLLLRHSPCGGEGSSLHRGAQLCMVPCSSSSAPAMMSVENLLPLHLVFFLLVFCFIIFLCQDCVLLFLHCVWAQHGQIPVHAHKGNSNTLPLPSLQQSIQTLVVLLSSCLWETWPAFTQFFFSELCK